MTAPELRALIDEVEKATGPSADLDYRLLLAFVSDPRLLWDKHLNTSTQSIDSAIAFGKRILGDDRSWDVRESNGISRCQATWFIYEPSRVHRSDAEANTPAVALVLAALRAYAAKEGQR